MLLTAVKLAVCSKYPDFKKRNNELLMEALWDTIKPTDIHQMREILIHFASKVFKVKEIGHIHWTKTISSIRGLFDTCMDFMKCLPKAVRMNIRMGNIFVKLMPVVQWCRTKKQDSWEFNPRNQ